MTAFYYIICIVCVQYVMSYDCVLLCFLCLPLNVLLLLCNKLFNFICVALFLWLKIVTAMPHHFISVKKN